MNIHENIDCCLLLGGAGGCKEDYYRGELHTVNQEQKSDWCLTEELFDKFSLRKVLTCKQDEKLQVSIKQVGPPIPEPSIPYPRISNLSIEDQKFFSETYKSYLTGSKEISFDNVNRLQSLMWILKSEQEEFSAFLQQHSLLLKEQYNFVHPQVKANVQSMLVNMKFRVQELAPHYTLFQTVSLSSGAVFPNDPILRFGRIVKQAKGQTLLRLPSVKANIKLLPRKLSGEAFVTNQTELHEDSTVRDILAQNKVHFVMTVGALQTLIDNHPPDYEKDWQLPLTVIDQTDDNCKNTTCPRTILIDDPLPPRSVMPREMNVLFFEREVYDLLSGSVTYENQDACIEPGDKGSSSSLSTFLEQSSHNKPSDVKETNVNNNGECTTETSAQTIEMEPSTKQVSEQKSQNVNQLCAGTAEDSCSIHVSDKCKKNNNEQDLKTKNVHYSYSLWTFGNLKILIRSTDNGLLYQSKEGEKGSLNPVNVFVKPEYQLPFGYEKVIPSEASRMWVTSYINPNSLSVCARVDPVTCELIRLDVLSQAAIINLSSFNPAQPMKTVHNVLTRLSKLLESGKFISSHSSRDMHTCIYEMVNGSGNASQETKKAYSYDLHSAYCDVQVMLKNYDKSLPWVSLDPNMFLDRHIAHARLPMTFPAVPSELLKKKTDIDSRLSKKTKKKKKKASAAKPSVIAKERKTQFKRTFTPQNNVSRRRLRSSSRTIDTDKPLDVSDTAPPGEQDTGAKMFERLRGKSKPTTYDDIEFDF